MSSASSALLGDIENTDDTITATDGKHLARVAEIGREARSRQVEDSVARLEKAIAIEHLDLVGARATRQDQIVRVLLELRCVKLNG